MMVKRFDFHYRPTLECIACLQFAQHIPHGQTVRRQVVGGDLSTGALLCELNSSSTNALTALVPFAQCHRISDDLRYCANGTRVDLTIGDNNAM